MGDEKLALNEEEAGLAREIAKRYGISEAEAASRVLQASIARRMKKRTGHRPAKVYSLRKK